MAGVTKKNKHKQSKQKELDGTYILKIVIYVILGSLWLKVGKTNSGIQIPLPIGFVVGLLFTTHEHFQIDRKIEYAVLIVAALFGFIAPYGLYINI